MATFDHKKTAADALRTTVQDSATSYVEIAKLAGVSRATITKFLAGRPVSPRLLSRIIRVVPAEHGTNLLVGHLNDEMRRAGFTTPPVRFADINRFSYILDEVAELLGENPSRIHELVSVIDEWKSDGDKPASPRATFKLGDRKPWLEGKDAECPYEDIPWSEPADNEESSRRG